MSEFELKALSADGITHALDRVERYRLMNQPRVAESICRDILAVDAGNHQAKVQLILALTDQFEGHAGPGLQRLLTLTEELAEDYDKAYYSGIVYEREAKARLRREYPGAKFDAYEHLRTAMELYERADSLHATGNEDARLHYNTCIRVIEDQSLHARPDDDAEPAFD
ncbi:MAG: hypothetical protein VX733_08580 [Candidatus Latescibacterota bacterium]|nr:hypothetical protein [Candidatus Latescibacterota bacterium]